LVRHEIHFRTINPSLSPLYLGAIPRQVGIGGFFTPMKKQKDNRPYFEKLKDPRWQRKRLEVMQRDDYQCRECHSETKTLHVHHTYYEKNTEPWEYPAQSLVTLCEECHNQTEYLRLAFKKKFSSMLDIQIAILVLEALHGNNRNLRSLAYSMVNLLLSFKGGTSFQYVRRCSESVLKSMNNVLKAMKGEPERRGQ